MADEDDRGVDAMGQVGGQRSASAPRLTARVLMTLGGMVGLVGSFLTWATFNIQFSIVRMTGVDLGYGLLTCLFAIAVIASGFAATGPRWVYVLSLIGALGILLTAAIAAVGVQAGVGLPGVATSLPEFRRYGIGLAVTAIGGGLALAGAHLRGRNISELP